MNSTTRIELSWPDISALEKSYVERALSVGRLGGSESFSRNVSETLADALECQDVLLTTSGTDALELGAMLLDLGPGDTVVIPSFTFASVATAFLRTGAAIRFADIEPITLGIDPASLENVIDSSVKVVAPVHYGGMAFDLPGVLDVLRAWPQATLIEDNAHGLFGTFAGRPLGTFGPLGATSFHTTKNLVAGEGGALLINHPGLVDRAHVMAEKGTDRSAFLRGMVDKYTWRDLGSSFVLAEPLAALLAAQLERRTEILNRRAGIHDLYMGLLRQEEANGAFALPGSRQECQPVRHLFYVILHSESMRDSVIADLRSAGIGAAFHYLPLNTAPAAARFVDKHFPCPVAEDVSGRLLRLPLHSGLEDSEVEQVVAAFSSSVKRHG